MHRDSDPRPVAHRGGGNCCGTAVSALSPPLGPADPVAGELLEDHPPVKTGIAVPSGAVTPSAVRATTSPGKTPSGAVVLISSSVVPAMRSVARDSTVMWAPVHPVGAWTVL